jgi:hypothetical protein
MGILNFLFGTPQREDYLKKLDHLEMRCDILETKLSKLQRKYDDPRDIPPGSKDPYSIKKARLRYGDPERRMQSVKERFQEMDDILEEVGRMDLSPREKPQYRGGIWP